MRSIAFNDIVLATQKLCATAAFDLPGDVENKLLEAKGKEESPLGKNILQQCLDNAAIARSNQVPICQDTGLAVFFVELGLDVKIEGGTLEDAINEGVRQGYSQNFLRKSIVMDPVFNRKNTQDNTPAIIHAESVPGDKISMTLAPKGGGSENMSAMKMLKPLQGKQGIIDFVVETVLNAGGNPCPPIIVGVGIGGNFEKVCYLAKKALLRTAGEANPDPEYAELEKEILGKINASGIGPQGLGGRATALAVHILTHPCHIASLPVAVNINCHAARHASVIL